MIALNSLILQASGPSMALPGPYWLFTALHWLTFALHLIAMNILFGGLLIFLLAGRSPYRTLMFDTTIQMFPTALAATITLGIAPLLFVQVIYGHFFYSATIVSGWNWFLLIPILIVVYYLLYVAAMKQGLNTKTKLILLAIAAAGFVYVSYTLTMISDLAEKPWLWQELYQASPGGFSLNPSFLQTFFRWAHSIIGGMAVAGLAIQVYALSIKRLKGSRDLLVFGAKVFLHSLAAAAVLGIIYLFLLDKKVFTGFMLSPGMHAILTGIALNIVAAVLVYRSTISSRPRIFVLLSGIAVFLGVEMMVVGRHYLRLVYLQGYFDPYRLEVAPQWGPFVMFLIAFVVALGVLFWMIRRYFAVPESA